MTVCEISDVCGNSETRIVDLYNKLRFVKMLPILVMHTFKRSVQRIVIAF